LCRKFNSGKVLLQIADDFFDPLRNRQVFGGRTYKNLNLHMLPSVLKLSHSAQSHFNPHPSPFRFIRVFTQFMFIAIARRVFSPQFWYHLSLTINLI
jgi:hypothetical protein